METTLSSKGQIVIPQQIRKSHGWRAGVSFLIVDDDGVLILKPLTSKKTTTLEDVIGSACYEGPKKSLSDMEAGILKEAQKQAGAWSR